MTSTHSRSSTFPPASTPSRWTYRTTDVELESRHRPHTNGIYSFSSVEAAPTLLHGRAVNEQRLIASIRSFRELPRNWDGYGGVAARSRAIADAEAFIERTPKQSALPRASLAGDGEISLYWSDGTRYLEASFPGNGTYHYFCDDGPAPVWAEDDLPVTSAPSLVLRRLLMRFFA